MAGGLTALGFVVAQLAYANYPKGHDNATNPAHMGVWTHGDPNTGLIPGSTSDGDYYLRAFPDGDHVWCEVYSGGNWQVQLIHGGGNSPVVAQSDFHGTGGRVAITNGTAGNLYGCRISNISPTVRGAVRYRRTTPNLTARTPVIS